jgi:hypothetical protein
VNQFQILPCPAGTIALVHPDIWHRGGRNYSDRDSVRGTGQRRHMVKFILERREFPLLPTWNHRSPRLTLSRESPGGGLRYEVWSHVWRWMTGQLLEVSGAREEAGERGLGDHDKTGDMLKEGLSSSVVPQQLQSAARLATKCSVCAEQTEDSEIAWSSLCAAFLEAKRSDIFDQSFYGLLMCESPRLLGWLVQLTNRSSLDSTDRLWVQRTTHSLTLIGFALPWMIRKLSVAPEGADSTSIGIGDVKAAMLQLLSFCHCSVPILRLAAVRALGWQQLQSITEISVDHILTALSQRISPVTEDQEAVQTYAAASLSKFLTSLPLPTSPSTSLVLYAVVFPALKTLLDSSFTRAAVDSYSHRYSVSYALDCLSQEQLRAIPQANEYLLSFLKTARWCPYTHPKSSY